MTQEEIIKYNRICAEFLGAEMQNELERVCIDKIKDDEMIFHNFSVTLQTYEWNGTTNIHYIPFDMLQFHSDWNWIMLVVEAIEKLGLNFKIGTYWITIEPKMGSEINYKILNIPHSELDEDLPKKKDAVVYAINLFLIWYEKKLHLIKKDIKLV